MQNSKKRAHGQEDAEMGSASTNDQIVSNPEQRKERKVKKAKRTVDKDAPIIDEETGE
jgi:hypothetical protein